MWQQEFLCSFLLQKPRQHEAWMVPLDFAMDSNSCRHLMFFKRITESPIRDNILQETHKMLLHEKTRFGWEAMDAIACEAAKWIRAREIYKQLQVRRTAGFLQLAMIEGIG